MSKDRKSKMVMRANKSSDDSPQRAEVVNARIYDGVHYRTSGEAGAAMGRKIGEYTVQNFLKPVR